MLDRLRIIAEDTFMKLCVYMHTHKHTYIQYLCKYKLQYEPKFNHICKGTSLNTTDLQHIKPIQEKQPVIICLGSIIMLFIICKDTRYQLICPRSFRMVRQILPCHVVSAGGNQTGNDLNKIYYSYILHNKGYLCVAFLRCRRNTNVDDSV